MDNKGQMGVNVLASVAIGLVVVALVSVIAIQIITDQQGEFTADTLGYNASADALEGVSKIPQKLPLIVTAVVGAILIGIVVTYFMRNK